MTRKRDRYTRARSKRARPKTRAPTDGFLIADVARLTAIRVRTLRDHVQRGLLRYSEFRGTLTRYPRAEVLRLFAALRLKAQNKATWAQIKRQLEGVDELELQASLAGQLSPNIAAELGIATSPSDTPTNANDPRTSSPEDARCWQRTELLPGLELFLSATASAAVRRAALRIVEEHVGR